MLIKVFAEKGELEYEFNGRNIEADLKVKTAYWENNYGEKNDSISW